MKHNEKLFSAIAENKLEAVGKMVNPSFFGLMKGADVNGSQASGWTPLMLASYKGYKEIVELLIAKGADVNARDDNGKTALLEALNPMHRELEKNDKEIAKLLIAKGADVNAKNNNGQTPLMFAANTGCKDIVELLVAKGADLNVRNEFGDTLLMLAAAYGRHRDVAELLLAKGADINAKNEKGNTALLQALTPTFDTLENDAIDIAKWLIAKGADVNAKNNDGQSALMLAQKAGCQEVVALLMAKGAGSETGEKDKTPIASSSDKEQTEKSMGKYWAYLHKHGKIQVKEWYQGNTFLSEASASPYVKRFLKEPFATRSMEDAEEIAKKLLNE